GYRASDSGRRSEAANPVLRKTQAAVSRMGAQNGFLVQERGGLRLALPEQGDGSLVFSGSSGPPIEVRERGASGPRRSTEGAVSYDRPGGSSTWRVMDTGHEEWLRVSNADEGPVASWDVLGARLRQEGDGVVLLDQRGHAMIRVTAPWAYDADGR